MHVKPRVKTSLFSHGFATKTTKEEVGTHENPALTLHYRECPSSKTLLADSFRPSGLGRIRPGYAPLRRDAPRKGVRTTRPSKSCWPDSTSPLGLPDQVSPFEWRNSVARFSISGSRRTRTILRSFIVASPYVGLVVCWLIVHSARQCRGHHIPRKTRVNSCLSQNVEKVSALQEQNKKRLIVLKRVALKISDVAA